MLNMTNSSYLPRLGKGRREMIVLQNREQAWNALAYISTPMHRRESGDLYQFRGVAAEISLTLPLSNGAAESMGDGVFVIVQIDEMGDEQSVTLTREDLGAMLRVRP